MSENILNEAPASVTYSIISPNGYSALFTVRETTGAALMDKMVAIEARFERVGYKPQMSGSKFSKPVVYVEGKMCPKCGGRLVEKQKKDGTPFWKCENQKYNPVTRENFGCDYIDWNAGKNPAPVSTAEDEPPMPDAF